MKVCNENNPSKNYYKAVIVGAGPAGLIAANTLANNNMFPNEDVLLIDSGKKAGNRANGRPDEITCGFGGAGLFSDGKFSFYPSAEKLWYLPDRSALYEAYEWVRKLLSNWNMEVPHFPENLNSGNHSKTYTWFIKEYPSFYLSPNDRLDLINYLTDNAACEIAADMVLTVCNYNVEKKIFELILKPKNSASSFYLQAKNMIFATGRFGPLLVNEFNFIMPVFKRLEIGFRIQQPNSESFFYDIDIIDPKFKFIEDARKIEWRTFCACRVGETVLSNTMGLWTVSGHSDCEESNNSNVGFNTRILNPMIAKKHIKYIIHSFTKKENHFKIYAPDLLTNEVHIKKLEDIYGKAMLHYMVKGLVHLLKKFPAINNPRTELIGPTLEGIGWYPHVNHNLKVPHIPAWIAGDCCGRFRGIIAAMISGYYAASQCARRAGTRKKQSRMGV